MPSSQPPKLTNRLARALVHCVSPRNWRELAARVARNPEFFVDLFDYAQRDTATRHQAMQRMIAHLRLRSFQGDAQEWRRNSKGFAETLINEEGWLTDQLAATPHFGAIGAPKASRLDYALLVNHELYRFKEEFTGFGLGCKALDLASGTAVTGLALAQCWSLLSNAGHAFGTFATERALLFELFREPSLKEVFLNGIAPELRDGSASILESHRLTDFYYALTSWRVSRVSTGETRRRDLIQIWAAFLSERAAPTTSALFWSFRSARRLAYNRLHTYLGIGPPVDLVSADDVTRAMSPWRELGYEPRLVKESSLLAKLLDAADAYQWEHHFAGPEVAREVLAHVRSFRAWWKTQTHDRAAAIDSVFAGGGYSDRWQPPGWRLRDNRPLESFARLKLARPEDEWLEEISEWLAHEEAWEAGNFLVAPRASSAQGPAGLLVDVYTTAGMPPETRLLHAVASRLASHCEASWSSDPGELQRELWRSTAVFGLKAFGRLATGAVRPTLRPVEITPASDQHAGRVGYGLIAMPAEAGRHAGELVGQLVSADRKRELTAALVLIAETAQLHPEAPMLLFLGTTLLVDVKHANKERAEFDGVWAFFEKDRVVWYLMEHKRSDNPTTALAAKLSHIARPSAAYTVVSDLVGKVAVVSVEYTSAGPAR